MNLLFLAACARPVPADEPLTVLAASSLTEVMSELGQAWTAQGNPHVEFSFDATSRLAQQVEAGAHADVFAAADEVWMDHLAERGLIRADSRVNLAGNRLVVVVPSSAAGPSGPEDLRAVQHLALGGEAVPVGRYARSALKSAGVWEAVRDRVVTGDDTRSTLAWVALGEADAGVVYATDARVEPRVRVAWTFAEGSHPAITYPGAVLADSDAPESSASFMTFCRSQAARSAFERHGFSPP